MKFMRMTEREGRQYGDYFTVGRFVYEKMNSFVYLGVLAVRKNCITEENQCRIMMRKEHILQIFSAI